MKFCAILLALAGAICAAQSNPTTAPVQASSETPKTGVVLTKLSPPIYPPLAWQARIMGDVRLNVSVRPDGSIESAEVISGHPMLKQVALDSVHKSTFECRECEHVQPSTVVYRFAPPDDLNPDPCCCSSGKHSEQHVETHMTDVNEVVVTITAPPPCMCPDRCEVKWAEEHSRYRSPMCLYLWKCGNRHIALQ